MPNDVDDMVAGAVKALGLVVAALGVAALLYGVIGQPSLMIFSVAASSFVSGLVIAALGAIGSAICNLHRFLSVWKMESDRRLSKEGQR